MVFINYRKRDSQDKVDHLAVRLKARFGPEDVFKDDSDLKGGDRWPDRLCEELRRRRVLLAIIGPQWLRAEDEHGRRRIDDPDDWVRCEICTALEQKKPVIVLLLDGTAMPTEKALPEGSLLQQLPKLQALPLRSGPDFESDLARLIERLTQVLGGASRPSSPAQPASRSLPARPPVCFGREAELTQLMNLLLPTEPTARVDAIPLAGNGGMGKSTLVLTALHHERVAERYGDQRYFVRLDGAASKPALLAALAETVGLTLGDRLEDRLIASLGRPGPRLLVLDNAETPLLAEDRLETEEFLQQLAGLSSLALVATLRGVQPLGPGWAPPLELGRLVGNAPRETFLAQAGQRFAVDPELPTLLQAVDGWPLGVTILGYRARSVPRLKDLLQEWKEKRTALLTKGVKKKDADVGACIELSLGHPLVTPQARRLLALLGILLDGIHHDDLSELLPGCGIAAAMTLRQVGGLAFDEGTWLHVSAPVREYLAEHLSPEPEDRDRAIHFYCERAKKKGNLAGRSGGALAIQAVAAEIGNLTGMVRLGLQTGAVHQAVAAVSGLGEFSRFSGVNCSPLLLEAETVAGQAGDHQGQADCIKSLGHIALVRSEHAAAREAYERALPLYEKVADLLGQANCIRSLGDIALRRSNHTAARQAYERALPLYEKVGNLLGQANCIHSLGNIALRQADHTTALQASERALPLYELVGDLLGQANCVMRLGDVALRRSDHAAAQQAYERALPLYEQIGNLLGQANCIQNLGDMALRRSDHAAAQEAYERALPLYERVGSLLGQANCIQSLGDIARKDENFASARERYQQALQLLERLGSSYSLGRIHRLLAKVTEGEQRQRHVQAAYEAWTKIDRPDLLVALDREFGSGTQTITT